MTNAIQWPKAKSLKKRLCEFCEFVRARKREALVARVQIEREGGLLHNNNNNNILYINEMTGGSVALRGIA